MTRDVLITISGFQLGEGDEEGDQVEVITAGDYFLKNGSHYILYDEISENQDVIKNTIKVQPWGLDIFKRGSLSSHMTFEKDKKNVSRYVTPFGEIMVGINTNEIQINEGEDCLRVRVAYSLDINYRHISECTIALDIQSRSTADIHLSP